MTVHFGAITPDNWRIFTALQVMEGQKDFVASNLTMLARAFAFRNCNSRVYAIYDDERPIGMLMQREHKEEGKLFCVLDQFMIAEQHQRKGYGKTAMKLWLSMIQNEENYDSILLCYIKGDEPARNFYHGLGFHHTSKIDEDEVIMEYKLKD